MATQELEAVQYRLTQHYIGKLKQANLALRHNRNNSTDWLQSVEKDWAQIRNWQQWAAARSADQVRCAELSAAFAIFGDEYISIRQSAPERLNWYRQGLVGAQRSGDQQKERELLYQVGTTAYQTGAYDEAEQCSQRLLELGRTAKDHLSLGHGWFLIGNIRSHRTELDAAEAAFRKAVMHFEKCHAAVLTGHAVQGIARIMIFHGRYSEALIHATRYLQIIQAAGRESDYSLAYHTLSNIHTRLGNLSEAKSYALKAVEISRRLGYIRMIPSNLLILGYAELAMGELDAAWGHFQETIEASRANLSRFDLTAATYSLGDVRIRQDNLSEALIYYQQALDLARETNLAAYVSLCSNSIAYIHGLRHDLDAARSALRTGAQVALEVNSDILLARALIPAVKIWLASGELHTAAEWSGVLMAHPEHAEQQIVDALCKALELEIGAERYRSAVERGKGLVLKDVVSDLLKRLA